MPCCTIGLTISVNAVVVCYLCISVLSQTLYSVLLWHTQFPVDFRFVQNSSWAWNLHKKQAYAHTVKVTKAALK